jgi:hypothetical protein
MPKVPEAPREGVYMPKVPKVLKVPKVVKTFFKKLKTALLSQFLVIIFFKKTSFLSFFSTQN